ncbi:MAG: ArnT family glycosyltransferase [Atribacterota bacterium]
MSKYSEYCKKNKIILFLPFVITGLIYLMGMGIDVMDVDAAQYASISREMAEKGNFLEVTYRGRDYLDKPPLLFWLSALSFKIFGISNVTYKLPSLLFAILGIFSTYKLGKLLYNKSTGYISCLILASCPAMFSITGDVRTDTILLGALIFSIWQLAKYIKDLNIINLVFGFFGIGLSMLAKGPIGFMVPFLGISTHLILTGETEYFFRKEWIPGFIVLSIVLLPMLIGLYNRHGWYGIKFYFWIQSFGRITGQSKWSNSQGPFYFVYNFLWAFLPWSVIFIPAIFKKWKDIIKSKFKISPGKEAITTGGFTFVFIGLSLSRYKLPHYIYVIFPLAAVVSGNYLYTEFKKLNLNRKKIILGIQWFVLSLMWLVVFSVILYFFPVKNIFILIPVLILFISSCYFIFKIKNYCIKYIVPSLLTVTGAAFTANGYLYPNLLNYQSASLAGKYARENNIDKDEFIAYKEKTNSMEFYARRTVPLIKSISKLKMLAEKSKRLVIYTNNQGLEEIKEGFDNFSILKQYKNFHISMLKFEFLNPATRDESIEKRYLIKVIS